MTQRIIKGLSIKLLESDLLNVLVEKDCNGDVFHTISDENGNEEFFLSKTDKNIMYGCWCNLKGLDVIVSKYSIEKLQYTEEEKENLENIKLKSISLEKKLFEEYSNEINKIHKELVQHVLNNRDKINSVLKAGEVRIDADYYGRDLTSVTKTGISIDDDACFVDFDEISCKLLLKLLDCLSSKVPTTEK